MLLKRTNIAERLAVESRKERNEEEVLRQVEQILRDGKPHSDRILDTLAEQGHTGHTNILTFDLLDSSRIYHRDQIRSICIAYRLRFLDSRYFKGEIPPGAVAAIKTLERMHQTELKGFKILAPSRLFKLEDKDDPLLFAPIGNGYYYLVHQWGNDLHPLRKWLVWPFRNIGNLALLIVGISYLATLLVPNGLFSKSGSATEFWIIFFFMFKSIAAIVIFYGFALGKNFNPAIWNSKYFNA